MQLCNYNYKMFSIVLIDSAYFVKSTPPRDFIAGGILKALLAANFLL